MDAQKKVLVVDDDDRMRKLLANRLEVEGYSIITAQDGEEAMQKVKDESPLLLTLDLMMPKINGYEACRMLRFDDQYKNLPIIILSALNTQFERDKAFEAGADAVFVKPFDLNLLVVKIKELLE